MDVSLQGPAYCTLAFYEAGEVGKNQVGKSNLQQIYTENRSIGEQTLQLVHTRLVPDLDVLHIGLCLLQSWIGTGSEAVQLIVDGHQVAQPAGEYQRDEFQVLHVKLRIGNIRLDSLPESNGKLLGSIGCDALRGVGHERVGETLFQNLADEILGVENLGIDNHRPSV